MRWSSCLYCFLIWVSLVAVISAIIWFFGHWLDYHRHRNVKFTVDDASLTRFDLQPDGTLRHNLTLAVSIRNGNKATVYYNKLEATAYFDGSQFGSLTLPRFSQWQKSTTEIHPSFHGQAAVPNPTSHVLAEFRREKGEGYYVIDVKFHAEIRVEWDVGDWDNGGSHTRRKGYAPDVDCWLKLPVPLNGSSSPGFSATSCDVHL